LVILVRLHGSIHSKCRLPTARTLLALPLEQQIQCRASGFVQSRFQSKTTCSRGGPALSGHGAEAVREAITRTIITLPEELRRSLTWDQGAEMSQHNRLKIDAGIKVYFCDPRSPWQRGTNENTNGLLRQYFPKGTDLSIHSVDEISAVAAALNARPRKTLGWRTPAEALDELLA
jgi:IS30 family transposase